jgi:aryl-alcohol dehydrogenase-like predicted oxidoreductase
LRRAEARAILGYVPAWGAERAGVTYFDTTFTEEAQSLGVALKAAGARREEITLSGMSIDMLKRLQDVEPSGWVRWAEAEVTERLRLLDTDFLDVFQICGMENGYSAERLEGALDGLRRVQSKGLVRFIGASSHDPELLARVIREQDPFDVAMTRLNYATGPCEALLEAVRERDVGFVAFKPFVWFEYGVPFLSVCRKIIERHGAGGDRRARPAAMALRWTLQFPEVSTVIPAVNSLSELVEDAGASDLAFADIDRELLEACRNVANRTEEIIDLLDHPHEEVRTFAHAAAREAVGSDLGVDKRSYREALRRKT